MEERSKVAIVGMGALGLLFGGLIQTHAPDVALEFVMDQDRAQKYRDVSFEINGAPRRFRVTAAEQAQPADVVIVAVKYPNLREALEVMSPCIGERSLILSLLNGISSEAIIGERYPLASIIPTVAQGMDAMKFGPRLRYTQQGELHIGITQAAQQDDLNRLVRFLEQVGIPYVVEPDILYRMWGKFMLNVGVNQTCMVYGQTYGQVLAKGESNRTLLAAFREVLAVAQAEGVRLTERDIQQYLQILGTLDPAGTPSMGQDRLNRKPSEVDMFAGTVMELGKKHGIQVPTNEFLYEQAKAIEQAYV